MVVNFLICTIIQLGIQVTLGNPCLLVNPMKIKSFENFGKIIIFSWCLGINYASCRN